MMTKEERDKMRTACHLLEPPASEVVTKCLNDLDEKDVLIKKLED